MMRAAIILRLRHAACGLAIGAGVLACALSAAPAAAPKADTGVILTVEQWAKIVKAMEMNGAHRVLPFKVADHLGLTKGTETLTVRELAFEREGYQHGIYRSVDPADQRIIMAFRTPEKRWTAFVADAKFRLISAIVWNAGETPVPWSNREALPAFRNELGYWSVVAELL
jgi:hypothetical protein